jgi:hypothetical protein
LDHHERQDDRDPRRRRPGAREARSQSRGAPFRDTLNDLLRTALLGLDNKPGLRTLTIKPAHLGYKPGVNHDSIESLLEYGEGELHR